MKKNRIAVIKYNAGNIRSVINALNRLDQEVILTDNHKEILAADKVILPGQGEANSAMNHLKERGLDEVIRELKQPFLGICLGLQLMGTHSEENDTECLGLVDSRVIRFPNTVKVPQIGWNSFKHQEGPLFKGLDPIHDMYFVHSYYMEIGPHTTAVTDYGVDFGSAAVHDNFYGVQFHPEKSGRAGETLLKNFLSL